MYKAKLRYSQSNNTNLLRVLHFGECRVLDFQIMNHPWKIFPLIAIKIIPLNTTDLWLMGIAWDFAKGKYFYLYDHTIYYSFFYLSNGIFYPVSMVFNNIINNKINNDLR